MKEQSFLILVRATPYGNHIARAAIDMALTAAAFEQKVTFVFLDAGVLQLVPEQDTGEKGLKNVGKMIAALKLYEVESVYAHAASIQQYGLDSGQLPEDILSLDDEGLRKAVAEAGQVMVF